MRKFCKDHFISGWPTSLCAIVIGLLLLSGCQTAHSHVFPQGAAPPPSVVMQKLPKKADHYKNAKTLIEESRMNPSARHKIPPIDEPTEFEKDLQKGFLALSIVRVVSTPFMLP